MNRQIFFDPQRKRWKRLRRILDAAAVVSTVILVLFFLERGEDAAVCQSSCCPLLNGTIGLSRSRPPRIKAKYSEGCASQDQPQAFGNPLQLR